MISRACSLQWTPSDAGLQSIRHFVAIWLSFFPLHPLFVIVNPYPTSQASVVQYRLIQRKNHSTVTSYSVIAILHHLFFSQAHRLFSQSIIYSYPLTCSGSTDLPVGFYFGIYNCFSMWSAYIWVQSEETLDSIIISTGYCERMRFLSYHKFLMQCIP